MKYEQVTMRNFLVYGKEQVVNIDSQGLVLIQGINQDSNGFKSNGAGKSTFLEAILYCLYGKLSDGKSGDDIINNKVKKNTKVTLTFLIGNDEYRIERYRKDKDFKSKTLLFLNDKEITKSSVKLTNEFIVELVQMSEETFLNSIVFGRTNKTKFTQANDKEKKQILEDMANISIYMRAYNITKDDMADIKDEITKVNSDIAIKNEYLNGIQAKEDVVVQQRNAYDAYMARLQDTYDNAKAVVATIESQGSRKDREDQYNQVAQQLQDIETKLQSINLDTSVSENYSANDQHITMLRNDYKRIKAERDKFGQQLYKLNNSTSPVCEWCGSVLNEEHKNKEMKRLAEEYSTRDSSLTTIEQQANDLIAINKELESKVEQENEVKANYRELLSQQSSISRAKDNASRNLADYDQQVSLLDSAKDALEHPQMSEPITPEDNKKDIEKATKVIKKYQKDKDKLEEKYGEFSKVADLYSNKGVISHVLDLIMPFINERARYYLGELTDNSISVNINPQSEAKNGNISEKLNIEVENMNGGNEYDLNSTGEKKRIDLSISLALQDYVMSKSTTKTNFIAYDEVFDGLDEVGIQRIMHLLKERVKDIPTVFVISHNDKLSELFEKTIRITKQDGLSTIEQEQEQQQG